MWTSSWATPLTAPGDTGIHGIGTGVLPSISHGAAEASIGALTGTGILGTAVGMTHGTDGMILGMGGAVAMTHGTADGTIHGMDGATLGTVTVTTTAGTTDTTTDGMPAITMAGTAEEACLAPVNTWAAAPPGVPVSERPVPPSGTETAPTLPPRGESGRLPAAAVSTAAAV